MEANSTEHIERQTLTVLEAAKLLGVGRTKMKSLIASGEIKSLKVGTRRLIPIAPLDEWVEAQIEQGQTDGRS